MDYEYGIAPAGVSTDCFPTEIKGDKLIQLIKRCSLFAVAKIRERNPVHLDRFGGFRFIAVEAVLDFLDQFIEESLPKVFYKAFLLPHCDKL